MTEFKLEELFPPDLENALGRMRHFISYARAAGLVKEDRGVVELTEIGKRYIKAGDDEHMYDVSPQQAEWLRRQLREKHMTDSIYHGMAIGLSLLASVAPATRVSTLDFGRSLAYLGRAGWDNENTFQIQGERYVQLLVDTELIDGERKLTPTGEEVRGELTLPVHMSLYDIAVQINPGGAPAIDAAAAAEWSVAAPVAEEAASSPADDVAPDDEAEDDDEDTGYETVVAPAARGGGGVPSASTPPPGATGSSTPPPSEPAASSEPGDTIATPPAPSSAPPAVVSSASTAPPAGVPGASSAPRRKRRRPARGRPGRVRGAARLVRTALRHSATVGGAAVGRGRPAGDVARRSSSPPDDAATSSPSSGLTSGDPLDAGPPRDLWETASPADATESRAHVRRPARRSARRARVRRRPTDRRPRRRRRAGRPRRRAGRRGDPRRSGRGGRTFRRAGRRGGTGSRGRARAWPLACRAAQASPPPSRRRVPPRRPPGKHWEPRPARASPVACRAAEARRGRRRGRRRDRARAPRRRRGSIGSRGPRGLAGGVRAARRRRSRSRRRVPLRRPPGGIGAAARGAWPAACRAAKASPEPSRRRVPPLRRWAWRRGGRCRARRRRGAAGVSSRRRTLPRPRCRGRRRRCAAPGGAAVAAPVVPSGARAPAESAAPPTPVARISPAQAAFGGLPGMPSSGGLRGDSGAFVDPAAIRAAAENAGLRLPDPVYANVAAALGGGKHLVLVGAPGAGKTALALAIARAAAQIGRANGATLITARHRWTDQELLIAAGKSGRWVLVDDLDRARLDRALGELSSFLAGLPVLLPDGEEAAAGPELADRRDRRNDTAGVASAPAPLRRRRGAAAARTRAGPGAPPRRPR